MTDMPSFPQLPPEPIEGGKRSFTGFLFLLAILLAAIYLIFFSPWAIQLRHDLTGSVTQSDDRQLADLEKRVQKLEDQIHSLDARLDQSSQPAVTTPQTTAEDSAHARQEAADMAHMQNDVIALSAALSGMQAEVKAVNDHVSKTQQTAQTSLASTIAYIQLRDAALTGQSFTAELNAMRDAAHNDNAEQDILGKLELYAAQGAPTLQVLREQLMPLETPALQAIDKKTAQSWWQKFLVELRGLVSIRAIHGGGSGDAFTTTESALDRGDIAAALNALQTLPPESQDVLADWRNKAEARMHINESLHALADHLTASVATAPTTLKGEP
jgi:hypothetical protein